MDEESVGQAVLIHKALAEPTRYRLVLMLMQKGEMGCADFAREFTLSSPAMSHHYRVLEHAGLIVTRKEGSHVFIRLDRQRLERFLPGFEQAARHQVAG